MSGTVGRSSRLMKGFSDFRLFGDEVEDGFDTDGAFAPTRDSDLKMSGFEAIGLTSVMRVSARSSSKSTMEASGLEAFCDADGCLEYEVDGFLWALY